MNYQGARERLLAEDLTADELIALAARFPGLWPEIAEHPLASADLVALILSGPSTNTAVASSMRATPSKTLRRGVLTLLAIFVISMVVLSVILASTLSQAKKSSSPALPTTSPYAVVSVYQPPGS